MVRPGYLSRGSWVYFEYYHVLFGEGKVAPINVRVNNSNKERPKTRKTSQGSARNLKQSSKQTILIINSTVQIS